jgi:hypothetical protein
MTSTWRAPWVRWGFDLEPLGLTSLEEARAAFREQITAAGGWRR